MLSTEWEFRTMDRIIVLRSGDVIGKGFVHRLPVYPGFRGSFSVRSTSKFFTSAIVWPVTPIALFEVIQPVTGRK